jgi:hypothetical protein
LRFFKKRRYGEKQCNKIKVTGALKGTLTNTHAKH